MIKDLFYSVFFRKILNIKKTVIYLSLNALGDKHFYERLILKYKIK